VFYYAKFFLISNSKSIHLQSTSLVVVVTIRLEQFKLFDVKYFYLDLFENAHLLDNYIIFGKNVFYRDIHIFIQQVRRVTTTKNVNKQLYLCLRKSAII